MKTLYALIFACLSLQACIGESETPTVSTITEYSTAAELNLEGTSHDNAAAPQMTAAKPKLEDYWFDVGLYSADDDHTAAVTVPTTPKLDDNANNTGLDFYADDDAWDFKLPETIDLHAIQAKDWW
jgi:hypothetical protein